MRWLSVRVSGLLLLIFQAGILQLIWTPQTEALEFYLVFSILTLLAVLAAIGFFFLSHAGWLLAMMTQSLTLVVSLIIYFFGAETLLAQLTMLHSILMVLYINSYFVRGAFRTGLENPDAAGKNP